MRKSHINKGFSLLELIVVLGILATLAFLVALVLDPVQMLARARDANRASDLDALVSSIEHAKTNAPAFELGGFDADGSNDDTCSGETGQTVYVSVPSSESPPSPSNLPSGWSYGQVSAANQQNIDGTGWLPVDFTAGSGTPTISALPVDPVSSFASGFYYSYVCGTDGRYELTANMISEQVRTGGPKDVQSADGGDDIFAYETGSDLDLNPKAPVGQWSIDEGSGITILDSTGNERDGTLNLSPTWLSGSSCANGGCLEFNGTDQYVSLVGKGLNDVDTYGGTGGDATFIAWIYPNRGTGVDHDTVARRMGGFHYLSIGVDANRAFRTMVWNGITSANYWPISNLISEDDKWQQVGFTLDSGVGYRFFVDGDLDRDFANTDLEMHDYGDTAAFAAQLSGTDNYFKGRIDEAAMFDRALTEAEVNYLYELYR